MEIASGSLHISPSYQQYVDDERFMYYDEIIGIEPLVCNN